MQPILTHHYCPEQIIYFQVTPKPTVVRVMPLTTNDNAFSCVAGELLHCDVEHDKIQSASTRTSSHSAYFSTTALKNRAS